MAKFYFDDQAADRAVSFFERGLKHIKGEWAGQPFILDEWQSDQIVRPLFGWKRPDGSRKYRTAYIEIPRKNGKSTLAAGIGLYLLFGDGEPGAEVYSAAADRDQARIVFDLARDMAARGVRRFIYTDIKRDGTLSGPNYAALSEFMEAIKRPVIAAGGVSSLDNLRELKKIGVEGAIIGQALYTGHIDLKQALELI